MFFFTEYRNTLGDNLLDISLPFQTHTRNCSPNSAIASGLSRTYVLSGWHQRGEDIWQLILGSREFSDRFFFPFGKAETIKKASKYVWAWRATVVTRIRAKNDGWRAHRAQGAAEPQEGVPVPFLLWANKSVGWQTQKGDGEGLPSPRRRDLCSHSGNTGHHTEEKETPYTRTELLLGGKGQHG